MNSILYEDNHIIVVEKKINVPVQADASGDKDFLEAKIARPKVLSSADFVKGYGQA